MYLRIISSYPADEVRALIELAAEPYDLRRVAVLVRNTKYAYRGLAYRHCPRSMRWIHAKATRAVIVSVGDSSKFDTPQTNVQTSYRWIRMGPDEIAPLLQPVVSAFGPDGKVLYRSRMVSTTTPYGGSKSPIVTFHTWREALVGVAAHEFHHIDQYQRGVPAREYYCERAADAALKRYRESATAPGSIDKVYRDIQMVG